MNAKLDYAALTVESEMTLDSQTFSPLPETRALNLGEAALTTDDEPEIQEELVIEEISIDGMCGVY